MNLQHLDGQFTLVQTVTFVFTGKVQVVNGTTIILNDALLIEYSNLSVEIQTCRFVESVPMPKPVTIATSSIIFVTALATKPTYGEAPKKLSKGKGKP
jgi:hypothetical protein